MGETEDDTKTWHNRARLALDKKARRRSMRKAEAATVRHARRFVAKRFQNVVEVRREIMTWLLAIVILLAAVGLQQLWFRASYVDRKSPSEGGTYAEAELGPLTTINPLYVKTPAEVAAARLVFASLFTYDKTGSINRELADSVTITPDGQTYTVKLKAGVLWHDDRALTTKDIAFTINLIKDPTTRSPLRTQWQDVVVKVIDEQTVQFVLPGPYAAFLHALTFAVLPEHLLKEVAPSQLKENRFSLNPVGSGPFVVKLVQNAGGEHAIVNLVAYDHFVNGRAKLSRFEIHAFDNQSAIIDALKTGQVTATAALTSLNQQKIPASYEVQRRPIDGGVYAFFNNSHPVLKEVAVRRALRAAIDTEGLRDKTGNKEFPLELPFVPGQLPGTDVPRAEGYNPKLSATLLDKAGWKLNGKLRKKGSQTLSIAIITLQDTTYEKAAELIAEDWRKIGVKVAVTSIDPTDSRQDFTQNIIQPRAYDVLVYELAIGADPDVYAYWHSSQVGSRGLNLSVYSNPTSDATLTSARARLEPVLRQIKYKAFAKQWLEDVPAIGLFQSSITYVANEQTTNIADDQRLVTPHDRYANILYWTAERSSVYKTP